MSGFISRIVNRIVGRSDQRISSESDSQNGTGVPVNFSTDTDMLERVVLI